jgi:hypothetical protein
LGLYKGGVPITHYYYQPILNRIARQKRTAQRKRPKTTWKWVFWIIIFNIGILKSDIKESKAWPNLEILVERERLLALETLEGNVGGVEGLGAEQIMHVETHHAALPLRVLLAPAA